MKLNRALIALCALAIPLAFQSCQKPDNPALTVGGLPPTPTPECSRSDSFGDELPGTGGTVACAIITFKYTLNENATLTQYEVLGPGGGAYSVGLYADSSGNPTTLVSSAGPVTGNNPYGWSILPVTPLKLPAGNYWLTISLNTSTGIWVDTGSGTGSAVVNTCFSGLLPASFPSGAVGAPGRVNLRADFCY